MKFSHMVLCMNDFSNNFLPHPTFLLTTSLSHKCKRLRDLVSLPFLTFTFNFMNERFSSFNVRFLYITSVIVYILISQNVKRRERERESVRLWKKKRKNIEDNIKEKKIIAICAILHAECLMLTQKKKKKCYLCNSPCCVFDVDKAWCMQPIVVVSLARGGQEHTHTYIYI